MKGRPRTVLATLLIGVLVSTPGAAVAAPSVEPSASGSGRQLTLPLSPRTAPVVALTGAEVVVFGGNDVASQQRGSSVVAMPRNDGAAYDPATGAWRTIATAPFTPALFEPSGVAIDGTLIVAGTPCDDVRPPGATFESCSPGGTAVGAYRPDTDSWRMLSAPPGSRPGRISTVVGRRGDAAVVRVGPEKLWLLDHDTDRWSALPDPPLAGRFCVNGDSVVAIAADPGRTAAPATTTAAAVSPPEQLFTAALAKDGAGWSAPRAVPIEVADKACGPPEHTLRLDGRRLMRVGADPRTGAVTLAVGEDTVPALPKSPPEPALADLVRRIDARQDVAAAAGPTAWFHEFNMAGYTKNTGGRAPADAVVFVVAGSRNKPFAIALNEVCIDWTDPESQVRLLQTGLARHGYSLLANIVQTAPDRKKCPQFGNVIMHVGNRHEYPRSFQYWYANGAQAPQDTGKPAPERRGGVCVRVNAFWVFFACSSHLTVSNETALFDLTYRYFQSVFYYNMSGPWDNPPDIDPAIPAVRAGDFNGVPGSPEMSGWLSDDSPWVEGDDALNRPTSDGGRKIDYIFASHTTGYSAAEVSGDLSQSDHRYYSAVFTFTR